MPGAQRVAVIGLGYVGLPLAVALARHFSVTGFDIDAGRVAELDRGHDRTGEVESAVLRASSLSLSSDPGALEGHEVFVVTVPTPVDADNNPDLGAVIAASRTVGGAMSKGAVVVFESTVYPGVTENICGPELEAASGLRSGKDFFLGYSPERINPGDKEHTIDRIAKVVAGQTPEITDMLAALYGTVTAGGVHKAQNIRTAEASKVIENAQRDINIAFINEVAMIFQRMGVSVHDVLEASRTKWNFLDFRPGLVGGHCIGVDPFYLAQAALAHGHNPEIILSGRRINDAMAAYIAERIDGVLREDGSGRARILVLGLSFKENVPDLRNSKVIDLVAALRDLGHDVAIHDPFADPDEARALTGLEPLSRLQAAEGFDCVLGAVAHADYVAFTPETLAGLVRPGGLVSDIKGMWRGVVLPGTVRRWDL